ncbi:MAG: alpha/beta hydrolase [Actinobacteria bacterium]|nr:alpha/beta hydrolase [Actinomycetota bacterium]
MEHVRVNGLDVAYRRAGSGPPVVFVHGAVEDSRTWTPQVEALQDDFTVVAWDEPGVGQSDDLPAEGFALADYSACLAGVIDSVGLGPAHVVGLSWGSTVALDLYHGHPEVVSTLILTGAYAGWKGSLSADEVAGRVAGVQRMLDAPPKDFDPALPGLFAAEPPAQFVPLLENMAAEVRRHSMWTALSIMAATDLNHVLQSISVPTLLLWGELDVRSPLRIAHEFEQAIPNATLVVIPECGHVTNLDRPDEFNRALREFCLRHVPSGG